MKLRMLAVSLLCLASCIIFACETTQEKPKDPPKTFTDAEKKELAQGVHALFKDQCMECHDKGSKKVYAKIDYILDRDALVNSKHVDLANPEQSRVYTECEEGEMPRKFDADGKPKIRVKLPKEKTDMILHWLQAGAPKWE